MKDGELLEILVTLRQYKEIMEGKLTLIPTEEVAQRVLRGINASMALIQKERRKNAKKKKPWKKERTKR